MNKTIFFIIFLCSCLIYSGFSQTWQSSLLELESNGKLTYNEDDNGYILPDFSHAGYMGGGVDLPEVKVVKELDPVQGDNTKHIQDAIDAMGRLEKDGRGIRGALLLNAGKYEVHGTIQVKYDGIVIRGVGEGSDPASSTILFAKGNTPNQRDVILMGNPSRVSGTSQISGTKTFIVDELVQVGSFSFAVEDASKYDVGDRIVIYHPASQAWIDEVDKGGVPYPDPGAPTNPDERWKEGQLPIMFNRLITHMDQNTISINAPVFYSLNKSVSKSYVYKPNMNGLISQIGLENLRVDIETLGGEDEAHAWNAVRFKSCENSWAADCTFIHFGQSGILTEACNKSTFTDCSALDPVSIITGSRRYNFNTYHYSQLNLFENCYASKGRHHYVSNGTSTTSGNVFLRCVSDATNSVAEGHRQWTQGMLYDNHKEINLKRSFVLGLYNRVGMGTGHGWAAVHSVLWNCDVDPSYGVIGLQKPPTTQNYAIGCFAKKITGNPVSSSNFSIGYVEGQNKAGLEPESLYEAQLKDRLIHSSVSKESAQFSAKIYPSPVKDKLNIQTSKLKGKKIVRIWTMQGQMILEVTFLSESGYLELSSFKSGVYFLELTGENGAWKSKFIKR